MIDVRAVLEELKDLQRISSTCCGVGLALECPANEYRRRLDNAVAALDMHVNRQERTTKAKQKLAKAMAITEVEDIGTVQQLEDVFDLVSQANDIMKTIKE